MYPLIIDDTIGFAVRFKSLLIISFASLLASGFATAALTVPTDVQMPGTQPEEVPERLTSANCVSCHADYDPGVEPVNTWRGSMMAHAGRDPVFWAAVAITEQTFDGAGDFCIRCHSPGGWADGRSTPTDGSPCPCCLCASASSRASAQTPSETSSRS